MDSQTPLEGQGVSGGVGSCDHDHDDQVQMHKHVHEHVHNHAKPYVMHLDQLPQPQTTTDIEERSGGGKSGLDSGFVPYGMPVSTPYSQQPSPLQGLPPEFLNIPFSTRKTVTSEQIMTVFGELVNEYQDDQTMTMSQINTLLRQRLKQKFNVE